MPSIDPKKTSSGTTRRGFLAATPFLSVLSANGNPSRTASSVKPRPHGLIDCQSHLFLEPVVKMMRHRKVDPQVYDENGTTYLRMGDWLRKIPSDYLSVEKKLASMDEAGIATTLLSCNDPGPEWFGDDGPAVSRLIHDSIADVVSRHPGRFYGLCVLPVQDEKAASDELDRSLKLGFKGILLYTNLAGKWCDEMEFHWLFARAEELGIPILLHPAKPTMTEEVKGYELTSTLGNMFENTIALARIIASGLLDTHPRLKLVCPHLGGTLPYISGRMDHQVAELKRSNQKLSRRPTEYLRDIYFDIVSPLPEAMRFALDFCGADKLLFASDHPWVMPRYIIDPFSSLKLEPAVEEAIFSGNARRLFGIVA